ncbi:division/cell wall cluster transcriptional repressor MraZ [Deferribacter thermophilus]|uniref:division/cell wall cluster transcriptional repressor MraZ n=1 Tax=Deferribacter thermophilus TaxID=53573 RepID=UPI003C1564FF
MRASSSFKGKSVHTINESGRISIPAKFRDVLKTKYQDESLVLVNLGKYLAAYPLKEWEKVEAKFEENPPKNKDAAKLMRKLFSTAEDCVVDRVGRIIIPPHLRNAVGLNGECVIVGMMNKIEIWPKDVWETEIENADMGTLMEEITDIYPEITL